MLKGLEEAEQDTRKTCTHFLQSNNQTASLLSARAWAFTTKPCRSRHQCSSESPTPATVKSFEQTQLSPLFQSSGANRTSFIESCPNPARLWLRNNPRHLLWHLKPKAYSFVLVHMEWTKHRPTIFNKLGFFLEKCGDPAGDRLELTDAYKDLQGLCPPDF